MNVRHVLIFTNSFPNPVEPERGIYTGQIAVEMARERAVTVVSPLPWFPKWQFFQRFPQWYAFARVPRSWEWRRIPAHRASYVVIPRLFGWSQACALYAAAVGRVREIHRAQRIDVISGQYLYPDGVAAVMIGRALAIPVVLTAHGSDVNYIAKMPGRRFQARWALRACAAATAVSQPLAREMLALGAPAEKVTVIPNGIDDKKFAPVEQASARRTIGLPVDGKALVFVGNLKEVKGLRFLLKALELLEQAGLNDFTTYLVGDGPLRGELEEQIKSRRLREKVKVLGVRPHDEIPLWMGAADVFCLPSLNEGMPNVVLEALASGTPVVSTSVGAVPDLVREENGILVPPSDAESLAAALRKCFAGRWDPGRIRDSVRGMTWAKSAGKYAEVFEEALATQPS